MSRTFEWGSDILLEIGFRNLGVRGLWYFATGRPAQLTLTKGLSLPFDSGDRFVAFVVLRSLQRLKKRGFEFAANNLVLTVRQPQYLGEVVQIPQNHLTRRELVNLIVLLNFSVEYGLFFNHNGAETTDSKTVTLDLDTKTVLVPGGVRFHLGMIDPWVLLETYYFGLHDLGDLRGKTVLDVGAAFGDSSLYFASKGAEVIAVEPVNSDALEDSLQLNPTLKQHIRPLRIAVGPEGKVRIFYNPNFVDAGAGSTPRSYHQYVDIESRTIASLLRTSGLDSVDVLKLDCKGCEYHLAKEDLAMVREKLQIEYDEGDILSSKGTRLDALLGLIEECGFRFRILLHNPERRGSLRAYGTIFASRSALR